MPKKKAIGWWCPKCRGFTETKRDKAEGLRGGYWHSLCGCFSKNDDARTIQKNWLRAYVEVDR